MYLLQGQLATNPDNAEPKSSLWAFWSESKQIQDLWNYIFASWRKVNPLLTPLYVGGIDCQYSGSISDSLRHSTMVEICNKQGIDLDADFPAFSKFMPDMTKSILNKSYFQYKIRHDSLMALNDELLLLADRFGKKNVYIQRYIDGIRNLILYSWEHEAGNSLRTAWRDSIMTNNFMLHRTLHPEEKIIVWTSNMHASKTGAMNYRNPEEPVRNFGNRLYSYYGKSLYVILFHNWSRESYEGHTVSSLKTSSVEYAIHKDIYPRVGGEFLFFSKPEEFGKVMCSGIMEGELVCSPGEMCDALIYEDTVEFIRYKDEEK